MAKLCRACQLYAAERGGVCYLCRHRMLKDPVRPSLRPGVWQLAVASIGLLAVASALAASAAITHHVLPWRRASLTKPPVIYEVSMDVEQATRKVYPYSLVPG